MSFNQGEVCLPEVYNWLCIPLPHTQWFKAIIKLNFIIHKHYLYHSFFSRKIRLLSCIQDCESDWSKFLLLDPHWHPPVKLLTECHPFLSSMLPNFIDFFHEIPPPKSFYATCNLQFPFPLVTGHMFQACSVSLSGKDDSNMGKTFVLRVSKQGKWYR